ncbi:MAG TPA: hypothetical protein VJ953_12910 [Saprospiraceae bacterium]|nr:hypothetical protein [Saprospiraceae bacterium]
MMMNIKKLLYLFLLLVLSTSIQAQDKHQLAMLDQFLEAHNKGTEAAISNFIEKTYHPVLLEKIDLEKHIAFYDHIIKEFGPLHHTPYEVVEVKANKLIVNLIKQDEKLENQAIDATEILMVEIDTDVNRPEFLSRGLGLGALACSVRKDQ